jgi:hypothetical protein
MNFEEQLRQLRSAKPTNEELLHGSRAESVIDAVTESVSARKRPRVRTQIVMATLMIVAIFLLVYAKTPFKSTSHIAIDHDAVSTSTTVQVLSPTGPSGTLNVADIKLIDELSNKKNDRRCRSDTELIREIYELEKLFNSENWRIIRSFHDEAPACVTTISDVRTRTIKIENQPPCSSNRKFNCHK